MDLDSARIITRMVKPEDRSFIMATWLKGNYYGNYHFGKIHASLYYSMYEDYVKSILDCPGVIVDVACDELKPDWVVGFLVTQGKIAHWAFVKNDYRQKGILNLLMKDKHLTISTAQSLAGRSICNKKNLFIIAPQLERKPKEEHAISKE